MSKKRFSGFIKKGGIAAFVALALDGCATFPRPLAQPNTAQSANQLINEAEGTVQSFDIDAGYSNSDAFMLRQMSDSDLVPERMVNNISITESSVFDALKLISLDAGLSLNIEGGINGSERFGNTSAFDVHGKLKDVMEELSESMGFFYSVRQKTLFIQQEQQFVVELPPALNDDNAADLTNTLQYLGAKDVYIDRMSRSLVFKSNRKSLIKIESYLNRIRETRSLIVYDVNILQVNLQDNSNRGIQWSAIGGNSAPLVASTTSGSTSGTATASTTIQPGTTIQATQSLTGMGFVVSGTHFNVSTLINFLETQGTVKTISHPKLAMINGTKGSLRVGQVTTYVSKVGTNFSTAVNQVTTETSSIKTGLELQIKGDVSDGTVTSSIGMSISEITSMTPASALGTSFTLPQLADRDLSTIIRARPGDMILIGGINVQTDSTNASKGINGDNTAKSVNKSEIVLTLQARVIRFNSKQKTAEAGGNVLGQATPQRIGLDTQKEAKKLEQAAAEKAELQAKTDQAAKEAEAVRIAKEVKEAEIAKQQEIAKSVEEAKKQEFARAEKLKKEEIAKAVEEAKKEEIAKAEESKAAAIAAALEQAKKNEMAKVEAAKAIEVAKAAEAVRQTQIAKEEAMKAEQLTKTIELAKKEEQEKANAAKAAEIAAAVKAATAQAMAKAEQVRKEEVAHAIKVATAAALASVDANKTNVTPVPNEITTRNLRIIADQNNVKQIAYSSQMNKEKAMDDEKKRIDAKALNWTDVLNETQLGGQ